MAIGLAVVMGAGQLGATVLVPADLRELSRDARTIARGRVIAAEGRWIAGRRGIETVVTLETESYLKGALGPTLQFRVPGGELGRYRQIVVGAPVFSEGQRVVVFLGAEGPRLPWLLGLSQGVYRIGEANGADVVHAPRVITEVTGAARQRSRVAVPAAAPERRAAVPLAAFEQEVRRLVTPTPATPRPRAVPR